MHGDVYHVLIQNSMHGDSSHVAPDSLTGPMDLRCRVATLARARVLITMKRI